MFHIIFILSLISMENQTEPQEEASFEVVLSIPKQQIKNGTPVKIKTTVTNTGTTTATFCDYHTPFEGIANRIFLVKRNGKEIPYQGKMKKRIPPGPEDYIKLKPGKSISCEVTIQDNYDLSKKGKYTIAYIGTLISGLPDSEEIAFVIE